MSIIIRMSFLEEKVLIYEKELKGSQEKIENNGKIKIIEREKIMKIAENLFNEYRKKLKEIVFHN